MRDRGQRWRTLHHIVGAVIVASWLVAVAAQALVRQRSIDFDPGRALPPSAGAVDQAYGIYYEGHKIGFAENRREPRPGGGARFFSRAYWRFRAQGAVQRLALESEAEVDPQWQLVGFQARIDAGLARIAVSGEVRDGAIELELRTGGRVDRDRLELDAPVLVPAVVRAYVAALAPRPGETLQVQIYNPLMRSTDTVDVLVEERTAEGWRISEILRSAVKTSAWIDRDGNTLREDSPMGFRMVAEPRAQALQLPEDSDSVPDLVFAAAAPASGQLPDDPRAVRQLTARIAGVALADYPLAAGDGQRVTADVLHVEARSYPDAVGYQLPHPLAAEVSGSARHLQGLAAALAPEPLLQSTDPELVATARGIVGDERDPATAARLLADWVHGQIRKASNVGVPSAVEVLASRRGDCNEHTVLYTALARAVGLPARMAAGVVLADLGGSGPGFYYHAWPEVWLDRWVPIDPTFGQPLADATHLRFIVGGLDQQVEILSLIGALRVELLSSAGGLVADKETP